MKKIKLFTEELINQTAEYLIKANYPIVLSGAGISAESGIPTFRKNDSESTKASYFGNYKNFIEDPKAWWENQLDSSSNPKRTKFRE